MTLQGSIQAEYLPHDQEPFMCDRQKDFFRRRLLALKQDILDESRETVSAMQEGAINIPDLVDRAAAEADRALELRTRDRQRKLIAKIDSALRRIEMDEYGYCEDTG
jgi:DnaK suppressor protein